MSASTITVTILRSIFALFISSSRSPLHNRATSAQASASVVSPVENISNWCTAEGINRLGADAVPHVLWPCPGSGSTLWRTADLCDGIRHCPGAEDEATCTPQNVTDGAIVIYVPRLDCESAICYSTTLSPLVPHTLCQQLARATFETVFPVQNIRQLPAIQASSVHCFGKEPTLQQCVDEHPTVDFACSELLGVTCVSECRFSIDGEPSGNISSPGYPDFLFPNLECMWIFEAPFGFVYSFTFEFINLPELWVDNRNCRNSHITLILDDQQQQQLNKSIPRIYRICEDSYVGEVFNASKARTIVRFSSGQYLGQMRGRKGFLLHYTTIAAPPQPSPPLLLASSTSDETLAIVLGILGSFLVLIMLFCLRMCRYSEAFRRFRFFDMTAHRRLLEREARIEAALPLDILPLGTRNSINENIFISPKACRRCHQVMRCIEEACDHVTQVAVRLQYGEVGIEALNILESLDEGNNNGIIIINNNNNNHTDHRLPSFRPPPPPRTASNPGVPFPGGNEPIYLSLSECGTPSKGVGGEEGAANMTRSLSSFLELSSHSAFTTSSNKADSSVSHRLSFGRSTGFIGPAAAAAPETETGESRPKQPLDQQTSTATTASNASSNVFLTAPKVITSLKARLRTFASWRTPSSAKPSMLAPQRVKASISVANVPAIEIAFSDDLGTRQQAKRIRPSSFKRFNTTPLIVVHPGSVRRPSSEASLASPKPLFLDFNDALESMTSISSVFATTSSAPNLAVLSSPTAIDQRLYKHHRTSSTISSADAAVLKSTSSSGGATLLPNDIEESEEVSFGCRLSPIKNAGRDLGEICASTEEISPPSNSNPPPAALSVSQS